LEHSLLGAKVPRSKSLHFEYSLLGSEYSAERKLQESESSLCGLFAPRNESAEERKVEILSVGLCSFNCVKKYVFKHCMHTGILPSLRHCCMSGYNRRAIGYTDGSDVCTSMF